MNKRGFSIVELVVVITIIGILLALSSVSFRNYQADARNEQRRSRAENISRYIENIYNTGSIDPPITRGHYPPAVNLSISYSNTNPDITKLEKFFGKNGFDLANLKSAGKDTYGFQISTSSTGTAPTSAVITPDYYIYQPISYSTSNGSTQRCYYSSGDECRSFNLYYMTEGDNVIHKISSIH